MAIIPLNKIIQNPEQPRKEFDPDELQSLAESIKEHGLINPISVEQAGDLYILIDGDRRVRAAKMAGLKVIEASIRPAMNGAGQSERLLLAMIANLQRTDLNFIEQAHAYQRMSNLGMTQKNIAQMVGVSDQLIYNRLCLLNFAPEIQALWEAGKLSPDMRVITALRRIPDDTLRIHLAQNFARRGTSLQFIVIVCNRLANKTLQTDELLVDKKDSPALQLATKQARDRANVGHWNAFIQAKIVPPWPYLVKAIERACKNCILADMAGETTCRDCPLVDLLKYLMESKQGKN
jgi:ParB/RepB/Spo0J family partition protein